jgi:hypothetical protein
MLQLDELLVDIYWYYYSLVLRLSESSRGYSRANRVCQLVLNYAYRLFCTASSSCTASSNNRVIRAVIIVVCQESTLCITF